MKKPRPDLSAIDVIFLKSMFTKSEINSILHALYSAQLRARAARGNAPTAVKKRSMAAQEERFRALLKRFTDARRKAGL